MTEGDPKTGPEMQARVASFISSGEDPNGYYVSAETLLEVISNVEDISEETRSYVLAAVKSQITTSGLVDSLKLGMTFGRLIAKSTDREGVLKIIQETKNLDNVPFVNIRGNPVN